MINLNVYLLISAISFQMTMVSPPDDYWRNPRRCGLNCLYGYLNMYGKDIELDALSSRVKIGPSGTSFENLQQVASEFGVPSSIVKRVNNDLPQLALPAIVHFDIRGGHYQLLLEVTDSTVTTADMLTGEIKAMPRDVFLETWSGYVLISGKVQDWGTLFLKVLGMILLTTGFVTCIFFRKAKQIEN